MLIKKNVLILHPADTVLVRRDARRERIEKAPPVKAGFFASGGIP